MLCPPLLQSKKSFEYSILLFSKIGIYVKNDLVDFHDLGIYCQDQHSTIRGESPVFGGKPEQTFQDTGPVENIMSAI